MIQVGGEVMWDASDPAAQNEEEIRKKRLRFGLVFQNFNLFPQYTALQNVMLAGELLAKQRPDYKANRRQIHAQLEDQARALLEEMGLSARAGHYPHQLSGGQQQRVAIARALAMNPKILLCDEATSALDPNIAETIMDLLSDINRSLGITIIVVTHQLSILKASCEQVYLLEKGRLAAQGDITSLFSQPPEALRRLMGKEQEVDASWEEGTVLRLLPTPEQAKKPILSRMARELGEDFSVLRADREQYRHGAVTYLLIQVPQKILPAVENWLREQNIAWAAEPRQQEKREEEAV